MLKNHKIIDSHCHIYPDKIASRAVEGIGKFYDLKMFEEKGTAEELLSHGKQAGVDVFMIFSVATKPSQVTSINEFIAQECAAHPGQMFGLGTIHPDSDDLKGDIMRVKDLGLKGIKIHPDFQRFKLDDFRYLKAYEWCSQLALPVLIHTGDERFDFSNPNRMKPVLECYPDAVFIGAHFGGWSVWEEAVEALHGMPNFYVDCSSSFYHLTPAQALEYIRKYGADRVLFGSDYPMWRAKDELDFLFSLGLSEAELDAVVHLNAQKIFKI